MKNLYYGLLMVGISVSMQTLVHGAALPNIPLVKKIENDHYLEYCQGNIHCVMDKRGNIQCYKRIVTSKNAGIPRCIALDATMFHILKKEYEKQQRQRTKMSVFKIPFSLDTIELVECKSDYNYVKQRAPKVKLICISPRVNLSDNYDKIL